MLHEISHLFKKQSTATKFVTVGVIMVLFVLYSLIGIIYRNYNINKQMKGLREEIAFLKEDSIEQESRMLYYKTDAYLEKNLREKLGYQKEGEKVYALPRKDPEREKIIEEQKKYQSQEDSKLNILKWYDFFFQKDKTPIVNNQKSV
jgi:cell division protein FtsB